VAIPLVLVTAGTVINAKLTGKVPLIVGWLGGFVIQALIRHWIWHAALYSALGVMTGVAFILFTNYMITDPGTTPSSRRNQVVFGLATAAVYGVLVQLHVVFGLFFALTITCALRAVVLAVAARRSPEWTVLVPAQRTAAEPEPAREPA